MVFSKTWTIKVYMLFVFSLHKTTFRKLSAAYAAFLWTQVKFGCNLMNKKLHLHWKPSWLGICSFFTSNSIKKSNSLIIIKWYLYVVCPIKSLFKKYNNISKRIPRLLQSKGQFGKRPHLSFLHKWGRKKPDKELCWNKHNLNLLLKNYIYFFRIGLCLLFSFF